MNFGWCWLALALAPAQAATLVHEYALRGSLNTLTFFADDFATGQGEASGGTVNFVRIYNGALTATEVANLFAAGPPLTIPEPATVALLAFGAAVMLTAARRTRRLTSPRGKK